VPAQHRVGLADRSPDAGFQDEPISGIEQNYRVDPFAARRINDRLYPLQQAFYAPPLVERMLPNNAR
jgi:hypothetical protein